ncbi:hypothetical protein AAVH_26821 [Aphelenchoides avenae]|nr:hypothetical protein AAVH_26821 [Aphelenchus avenae]
MMVAVVLVSVAMKLTMHVEARDWLAACYKGACFDDDTCKSSCLGCLADIDRGTTGGHCSTWFFGQCWCEGP